MAAMQQHNPDRGGNTMITISALNRTPTAARFGFRVGAAGILASVCLAVGFGGVASASAQGKATNRLGARIETTELDTYLHTLYYRVFTGEAYVKPWTWTGYQWKTTSNWYGPNQRITFESTNVTNYASTAVEFYKYYPGYGPVQFTEYNPVELTFSSAGLTYAQGAQRALIAGSLLASIPTVY
jgi:hypothetical protein